jgi:Domain of unknown function (DUF4062)/HEAT repeats
LARIYVSSTFSDLQNYRKAVSVALRRLGHEDVAMEYYVAEDKRPLDRCLEDVGSCDAYVGIFAWRYGYVPDTGNPDQLSITELEYRRAKAVGKTCLVFLISEDADWPKAKMEIPAMGRIEALRHELMSSSVVDSFENVDELTRKVTEAIVSWEKQTGLTGRREPADWQAYRDAAVNRHRWVRLQVIAGASKERDPIRIPLTEVFEPQLVTPGASGTDVPDEVRRYQQDIYGERPEEDDGDDEDQVLAGNPEDILDVLGRERTQVILGGPGSGKSTLLQYAMLRVCTPAGDPAHAPRHLAGEPIPFLIELRNYVLQRDQDFVSYLVRRSDDFYGAALDADSLTRVLAEDGNALVFFDGLDEVFDPDERRRVIDQFQAFARRYPACRIVVTSRIAGYDRTALGLAGFGHYTLMPLTLGHIRNFADRWYEYYTLEGTERTAQGLVQRIIESPRLLDLAGNPLLLTMMAVIYKDRDLPNERWRLYERCAETLLEDWDIGKGIEDEDFKLKVPLRTAQKSEILEQVSLYMLEHSQPGSELNAIAYVPLQRTLAGYLTDKYQLSPGEAEAIAVDILRHLMERTYVLAGIGERIFGFVHRTFMEYFAARRCLAQFNARKSDFGWLNNDIFGSHWRQPEWEEVLLLLIAMLHDQGTPIRDVVHHLYRGVSAGWPSNVAFAVRCLGEAGDVQDQAQAQELLGELAQHIADRAPQPRRKGYPDFTETALKSFAVLAPLVAAPQKVQTAIDRLNQADNVTARTAAWQMGFALRSRKDRLDYASAALQDSEEAVRRGAIAALEREWPGRPDIAPSLAEVVKTDRQSRVRLAALAALERSWRHNPVILAAIDERVGQETAETVIQRLIEYLTTTWGGNPRALEILIKLVAVPRITYLYKLVTRHPDEVSRAIVDGWGGDTQALGIMLEQIVSAFWRPAREMLLRAVAQGWGGDTQALAFLQDRAMAAPTPPIREIALQVMANVWRDDAQALAFVQNQAVTDRAPLMRLVALQVVAQAWAGDAGTLAFLQDRATGDPAWSARVAALQAIAHGWDDNAQALAFLQRQAVSDPDPSIRGAARRAIAQGWKADAEVLALVPGQAADESEPEWVDDVQTLARLVDRRGFPETLSETLFTFAVQGWGHDADTLAKLRYLAVQAKDSSIRNAALRIVAQWLAETSP